MQKKAQKTAGSRVLNQQLRTRKDILQAAARLLEQGLELTMEEVAKEALISRATAYRYFPDINDLMAEVVIDQSVPDPKELFREFSSSNMLERIDYAESVMHNFIYENEKQLRILLSRSLIKQIVKGSESETGSRQNRRAGYIDEALSPFRAKFDNKIYKKLKEALALVFGPEAMIVFRDVIPLDKQQAREVKSWVITTLVNAALRESRK